MANKLMVYVSFLVIATLTLNLARAGKVLVLSMQMSGHLTEFGAVGEELIAMGHEVHVVLDENLRVPYQLREKGFKFFRYRSPDKEKVSTKAFDELFSKQVLSDSWDELEFLHKVYRPRITHDCNLTLNDLDLFEKIKHEKFDIALLEGLFFCYHLLPYKLHIPVITLSTALYPGLTRTYPPFSVFGCALSKETNTIFNRMYQLFMAYLEEDYAQHCLDESVFLDYIPGKQFTNLYEVARKTKLWLICLDNILDCPRPVMPNVKYVGGIDVKEAHQLPEDLVRYVSAAKDGVIVVSFGSMFSTPPGYFIEKFLTVFKKLKQRVVWRLSKKAQQGIEFPENVKPMAWLPQNDLLGNNNTKLFITHSGNNGQWEAFYHGVPMLGFPTFGDQGYNTERIVMKRFGLGMNIRNFTTEELLENINELLQNDSYRNNIKKASALFRTEPHPRKVAARYVDQAIRFGMDHFQSIATDLDYIQFLMFDIYAVVYITIFVSIWLLKRCLLFVWKCVFRKSSRRTKDSKKVQ